MAEALAQAEGLKAVNPDKRIVVFSGDGDCAGIGGNHLIHAAKRNVDMTVIMMSNYIYGMTGGQRAPTTPYGATTKTSPLGNEEHPFDMYKLVTGAGATFYARASVTNPVQLQHIIVSAMEHKGFSFIEVLSPCPTTAGLAFSTSRPRPKCTTGTQRRSAMPKSGESVSEDGKITLGVLYEDTHKEELCDVQAEKQEAAKK